MITLFEETDICIPQRLYFTLACEYRDENNVVFLLSVC